MKTILILPFLALASCRNKQTVSHVPETEAVHVAREAAQDAFSRLSGELATAIAAGGTVSAIPICSAKAHPLVSAVATDRKIHMRRLSDKPRNPQQMAHGSDRTVIKSFRSAIHARSAPKPALQRLPDGSTVVRLPILINQPLCLQCHGTVHDMTTETRSAIKALYPDDQATGYRMHDLRGIWQITFPPPPTP